MPAGFAFLAGASPVLAFAHRGGARHPALAGLENTRAAFAHAVALGYDYLETDVQVTRDGVLVAFHDTLLQRVTDGVGSIEELDAADLARIRVGGSESIPTLSDLVEGLAHTRFNIDVKSDAAVEPLARLIRDRDLYARVLVGSFSGRRVRRFRRLTGGRVPTAASPGEVAAYVVLPGRVARCLTRARPAALQIPRRRVAQGSPARPRRRAAGPRLDRRRPRGDAVAPRPWCRRPHDRSHRHTPRGAA
jgi:glycerophosphoryl diester phosphodiesterase